MSDTILRRYGEATTVDFELWNTTGTALKTDAAHASGDTKLMKDEGAEANTTNGFVDEGQTYSLALTSTEMQAARVVLIVVDQTSPVWLDKVIRINTYGHPSAQHPEMGIKLPGQGVLQAGSTNTTAVLAAAESYDDDDLNGMTIFNVTKKEARLIVDSVGSTDTVTLDPAVASAWASGDQYAVLPSAPAPTDSLYVEPVNVTYWAGVGTEATDAALATPPTNFNLLAINGSGRVTAGAVIGDVQGHVQGDVQGNVDGSVGSVATGGITEASFATTAELAALPGTGALGPFAMLRYLYQKFRFKEDATASAQKMYKADGSTALETRTVADDGTTFTRSIGT